MSGQNTVSTKDVAPRSHPQESEDEIRQAGVRVAPQGWTLEESAHTDKPQPVLATSRCEPLGTEESAQGDNTNHNLWGLSRRLRYFVPIAIWLVFAG